MALEPSAGPAGPHVYSHPLIDWSAAIAGALVAIVVGIVFAVLGVAVGATALNPWQAASDQAHAWTIAGGLYLAFSHLVAFQLGAFVAARAARWPDHHDGMLQGIVVWALGFTVAAGVLGLGLGGLLSEGTSVREAAGAAVDAAQAATGEPTGATPQLTPEETDAVQDAAAMTAWWAFATLMLGAVGAVAGGKLGADHPNWTARERVTRATTMADRI